jgi:chromosome segregation protein
MQHLKPLQHGLCLPAYAMRIKSAEITGFKSFSDKVTLSFLPGITALVGPNGCGKSNIVDAFRWAMGEQSAKQLRGHIMEDIIFNGSETKKPMSMAEVSISFSNENGRSAHRFSAYTEITVTRRLFRSGESEYYVNKVPCRLKDIIELFLDTGAGPKAYSIIEQGKVEHVINAKPLERRLLIDEAAGISKYKSRKKEALAKMESTRNNLLRIDDILVEVTRQLNSIKRQTAKLKRYQALKNEIKAIELSLSHAQYRSLKEQHQTLQSLCEEGKQQEIRESTEVSVREAAFEQDNLDLHQAEKLFQSAQAELYQATGSCQMEESTAEHLAKDMAAVSNQQQQQLRTLESLNQRIAENQAEEKALQAKNAAYTHAIAESTIALTEREKRLTVLKESYALSRAQIDDEKNRLIDLLTGLASRTNHLTQLEKNHLSLLRKIDYTREESKRLSNELLTIEENLAQLLDEQQRHIRLEDDQRSELSRFENLIASITAELGQTEILCNESREHYDKLNSRLTSLQELHDKFEECENGVRSIMLRTTSDHDAANGIRGLLADFIQTEPQYETAVEAVLGEKLHYIIVESHLNGIEALDYIKAQALGKASIVPLDLRLHASSPSCPPSLIETRAMPLGALVSTRDEYRIIIDHLLSDVILVDSLSTALAIWHTSGNGHTMVTRDGEVVDPAGIITGGRHNGTPAAFLGKRREILELRAQLADLLPRCEQQRTEKERLSRLLADSKEHNEQLKDTSHREALHHIALKRDIAQLQKAEADIRQRIEVLNAERQECDAALAAASEESERIQQEKELMNVQKSDTERLLQQLQQREHEANRDIDDLNGDITALKISIAADNERCENTVQALKHTRSIFSHLREEQHQAHAHGESLQASFASLSDELLKARDALAVHLSSKHECEQALDRARQDIVTREESLRASEQRLRECRRSLEARRTSLQDLTVRIAESVLTINHLLGDIEEKYHVRLEQFSPPADAGSDTAAPPSDEEALRELKERLERLGEVNLAAAQEEEELAGRFQFLTEQRSDLTGSLDSLQQAIKKINRATRERFLEAFSQVNEQFKKVFAELFQGGKAELKLTDEENILETGIDIVAQPPGKKLQDLDLLSGGEKSLTAFALLIAIFLVKPSPFCILDEADSALDDTNANRFNRYLQNMSHDAQFIIITHNKLTMQVAHTLYGITMQEPGTSKVVSVQLQ